MANPLLEELRERSVLADGAMGSYLFSRTGRLSEGSYFYEGLCIRQPQIVQEAHLAYLQAGARCLTTNTFAANRSHLRLLGEEESIGAINAAGVQIARDAIQSFQDATGRDGPYFVLGSVGPTLSGDAAGEVDELYGSQLRSLTAAGVDGLLLETFSSLQQVLSLLQLLQALPEVPPVIIQMCLRQQEGEWIQDPATFAARASQLGASVIGANCCTPWEVLDFVDAVEELTAVADGSMLLSAMPNAGGFQRIGHRYMTGVNPEFMGKLARSLADRGVRLLGGCCEVHPGHINEMHNYLHGRAGGSRITSIEPSSRKPADPGSKRENGPFSRKLIDGEFAVSVELLPPRGTAPGAIENKVEFIRALAASGRADAIDITDGSRGIPLMPPGDFITFIRDRLGWSRKNGDSLELVPHFTSRDLNLMGLQSRMIGFWANRVRNLLFITGDPPKMSPTYPRSSAVFDVDSVAMIDFAHNSLNAGVDFGGQPLGKQRDPRTRFTIGTGFEPEALNPHRELERLQRKIAAGADYVMTQPAFRLEPLEALEPYRSKLPIVIGVMILTSLEHARRVGQIPGVVVPDSVYDRIGAFDRVDDQGRAGRAMAVEQIAEVRRRDWSGLYLMSPSTHEPILDVLEGAG